MNNLPVKLHPHRPPGPLVPAPATATVMGAGKSGIAAARLLLKNGYRVRITDSSRSAGIQRDCRELAALGARVELGEHTARFFAGSDFIVISPGIDERMEFLQQKELRSIPVFSEVEEEA